MSCIEWARTLSVELGERRIRIASAFSASDTRNIVQLLALALGAASLAGCAQSVVTQPSELQGATQRLGITPDRTTHIAAHPRVKLARKIHFRDNSTTENRAARHGVASFYTEGTETASGEKFDSNELTAAHRTLPFGTRLRVTNVTTGRSVTVRVNDRGPFIRGRDVDVSYSAAEALGMVDKGVANVKLDVVQ
jgi:rare lipoprotein A